MAQPKSKSARRSTSTPRNSGGTKRKRLFTRDPGAEARRAARKRAARKRAS